MIASTLAALVLVISSPQTSTDYRWATVAPYDAKLNRIAYCEWGFSSPKWFSSNRSGTYFGGLQFSLGTWRSVGGHGYPHQNSILEQKYRAVKLIKRNGGYGDWPYCGRM